MYKSVYRDGKPKIIRIGEPLPPLTNEDRKAILEMFVEHSNTLSIKEEGVWKPGSPDFLK